MHTPKRRPLSGLASVMVGAVAVTFLAMDPAIFTSLSDGITSIFDDRTTPDDEPVDVPEKKPSDSHT